MLNTKSIFLLSLFIELINGQRQFPIGLILLPNESELEIAFYSAIDHVNQFHRDFQLSGIVKIANSHDSYVAEKIACELIAEGCTGIFGPTKFELNGIVDSICEYLQIPHLTFSWRWEETKEQKMDHTMVANVYPDSVHLSKVFADFIAYHKWNEFTVIYESIDGLMRLQNVLQFDPPTKEPISVRPIEDTQDFGPLLKKIKESGHNFFIFDCQLQHIVTILQQAHKLGLLEEYENFIFTNPDFHTLDYSEFANVTANITAIRFLEPQNYELLNVLNVWKDRAYYVDSNFVKTDMIMLHDAVTLFANGLKNYKRRKSISMPYGRCESGPKWADGLELMDKIRPTETQREENFITGPMLFRKHGERIMFEVEIVELHRGRVRALAKYNPKSNIMLTGRTQTETEAIEQERWTNKVFRVVSRIGAPFLDFRENVTIDDVPRLGNDAFQGYCLDLVTMIANKIGFKFQFELAPDNNFGSFNKKTKKWNGIVRQLIDGKGDFGICDLTITAERRQAVDFTAPFMSLGISILFGKPQLADPDLFSFLSPFSIEVWLYTATAYILLCLLLFVLARMASKDWTPEHPCPIDDAAEVENIWHVKNTSWLIMGSIMGQGSDIMPKARSTRLVIGVWWFFALMMLNSYTANLAAFLTMSRMEESITGAGDLAKQNKIKYGLVHGGATMDFFKRSNFSTYQRMWTVMESSKPTVFVKSNDEGRDRVLKSKRTYAFLMESTIINYITERYCDLQQVGGLLDVKYYGIALPFNSPYRSKINQAILELSESSKLKELQTKWWEEMLGGGACPKAYEKNSNELGIDNVGGVFLILGCGIFVAFCILALEFFWHVHQFSAENKLSVWETCKQDLIFAVCIWKQRKPIKTGTNSNSNKSLNSEGPSSKSILIRQRTDSSHRQDWREDDEVEVRESTIR